MPDHYTPYWPTRDKQTAYSLNRLKGMNMEQSALAAGYSPSTANVAANKMEPKHNQSIREALEQVGVTNNRLAIVIQDGLSAEDPQGNVNYRERREYTKLALEAKGELKSNTAVNVTINMPSGLGELLLQDSHEYIEAPIVLTNGADSTE